MSCRSALFNANSIYCSEYNRCDLKLNEENSIVVQGMHRETQWFTGDDRGVQGMTEAYSSTQGICTVADRGLQGEQGLCTGK